MDHLNHHDNFLTLFVLIFCKSQSTTSLQYLSTWWRLKINCLHNTCGFTNSKMNLFRRGASAPERKSFSMTGDQILEDIMSISNDEQRNKLYLCLDEKAPQEHKFSRLGDFMKGTQDLETLSEKLADVTYELSALEKEVKENTSALKVKIEEILHQDPK